MREYTGREYTGPQETVNLYGEQVPVPQTVEQYAEYDKEFNPDIDEAEQQQLIDEGKIGVSSPAFKIREEKRSDGNWQLLLPDLPDNTTEW